MRLIKLNAGTVRHALAIFCLGLLVSGCGLAGGHGSLDSGTKYQAEGKYRAAYIEAKKVLQKDNKNGDAWLLLGHASLMLGDPKDALNDLQNAKANGVPEARWAIPMGRTLLALQQNDKLLKTLPPDNSFEPKIKARVDVLRGDAYLGLKQSDQAKQSYQAALTLEPDNARALVGLAKVAAIANDMDAAGNYVKKALAASPENPQALVTKGDLAFDSHDFAGAEADFQKALDLKKPDWLPQEHFYALTRVANAQAQQNHLDKALANILTLEKMSPQQPYPHYLHAVVLYKQGHLDDAVTQLQQVLKAAPDNSQAQFLLGAVNYAQANYSQAEMNLSNVMGTDPKNVQARKLLALTLYREGRSKQALDALRPTLPGSPTDTAMLALLQRAVAEGAGTSGSTAAAHNAGNLVQKTTPSNPLDAKFAQAGKALNSGNGAEAVRLLQKIPPGDAATEAQRTRLLVMAYLRDKKPDEALKSAAAYVKKNPNDSAAHLLYGTTLVAAGKHTEARTQYSEAYKLDPKDIAAVLSLASLDLMEGHTKDASGRYETVLKQDPKNTIAINALGRLALLQGDQAEAVKRFKQAIDAVPKSPTAYVQLVMLYSGTGQFDKAVSTAKQLVVIDPNNPAALNALGAAQLAGGHHSEALQPLQQAVKLAPKVPLFRNNLARAQILNKDTKDAKDNLDQVIKADPSQVTAVTLRAYLKSQDHDLPGAIAMAKTLQKQTANKAAGYALEGDLYMANKSYSKAAQVYQQGLKIDYDRPLVVKSFMALSASGDKKPAGVLTDWLAKHPQDASTRLLLGQYYSGTQQNTLAATQYEKVLKAYPSNVGALNNLAWIYAEQHNPKAIPMAQKAYKLAPQSPNIADTYAWALISGNQAKTALPILVKAAKAAPTEPTIQYHLAVAQSRTGDKADARTTLEALQKSGTDFQEKQAAAKLYRELGGADGGNTGK